MPLFSFAYCDEAEFQFSDPRFSIRKLELNERWFAANIFSKYDKFSCEQVIWAIVAEGVALSEGDFEDVNLLLMTFVIFSENVSPFIKYRLSDDANFCARVNDTVQPNCVESDLLQIYYIDDLKQIDEGFQVLKLANSIAKTSRVHNAIYFLYLATHTIHWVPSFVFLMSALEALFSNDSSNGATATIKRRVTRYLNDASVCTESEIDKLYDVRSRIVHGVARANDEPKENLKVLKSLEMITCACFRTLIQNDDFKHFATKAERKQFVSTLD